MSTKKLQILGQLGEKIYKQNEEPVDAPDGALWVDLDAEGIESSGGNVDLTGYATEQWVQARYQPKGDYLTEVPEGYATEEFVKNKIAEAELSGEEVDLSGYAQKSELPTKVSQLENDKGYLTEVPDSYAKTEDIPTKPEDISAQPAGDYALKSEIPNVPVQSVNGQTGAVQLDAVDVGALPNTTVIPAVPSNVSAFTNDAGYLTAIPSEYITETELTAKGYLTEHQSLSAYAKTSDLGALAKKDTVENTDLASDVQTSLNKANSALQSYTETDPTVPAWAKKSTKPTYTANEVGADASGTASSLLSSHNVASNAHADIRSSISDLSLEVASIHDEVYIGSGTPTNGEKIQIDLNGSGSTLTIPDVLQTTGNSTEDTMSQKAITDALSNATVSDTQIATAVENYIAENPISGSNGKDGRGVVSTTRTSGTGAAGTTDTYTMTYTDNTTSTFTVYNGKNGTNGKSAYSYAQSGGYTGTESAFTTALANAANQSTETWTFTLEDGSTVSKTVVLL